MLRALVTFAALSMAGTVIMSLLPDGSLKRTAAMVLGLLSLLCWTEGIALLLGLSLTWNDSTITLVPTSVNVEQAHSEAAAALAERWE